MWAAVAAVVEGGGCAGVVCRIVPVAPRAQPGLIPFTADSRRDKNKGSARGRDTLVRGVLKHTSSNWVEACGRMPQKMGLKQRARVARGVSEESGAKVASPSQPQASAW